MTWVTFTNVVPGSLLEIRRADNGAVFYSCVQEDSVSRPIVVQEWLQVCVVVTHPDYTAFTQSFEFQGVGSWKRSGR